jgi:hypothetical protein
MVTLYILDPAVDRLHVVNEVSRELCDVGAKRTKLVWQLVFRVR